MKLHSLNLASRSTTASRTTGIKIFPRKGRGLGQVTLFKILTPINISVMHEATLFKFGKWIDYGKSHPQVNSPPRKGCGLGHVIVLG